MSQPAPYHSPQIKAIRTLTRVRPLNLFSKSLFSHLFEVSILFIILFIILVTIKMQQCLLAYTYLFIGL